jgi:hypothetical protein
MASPPFISADELDLASLIKAGETAVVGQGTSEPQSLTVVQRQNIGRFKVFLGAVFPRLSRPKNPKA